MIYIVTILYILLVALIITPMSNKSKKQWDKNPNFKVFVVDKKWEMVPSTQRNISKTIN